MEFLKQPWKADATQAELCETLEQLQLELKQQTRTASSRPNQTYLLRRTYMLFTSTIYKASDLYNQNTPQGRQLNEVVHRVIQELYGVLVGVDEFASPKIRFLCAALIRELSQGELPAFLTENFKGNFACYDESKVYFFLSLLAELWHPYLLLKNKKNLILWITRGVVDEESEESKKKKNDPTTFENGYKKMYGIPSSCPPNSSFSLIGSSSTPKISDPGLTLTSDSFAKSNTGKITITSVNLAEKYCKDFHLCRISLTTLMAICCSTPNRLSYSRHIVPVESAFMHYMLHASLQAKKTSSTSLFGIKFFSSCAMNPVLELDGVPCRGIFTCLNIAENYTKDQLINVQVFSMLYCWLFYLYQKQLLKCKQCQVSNELISKLFRYGILPSVAQKNAIEVLSPIRTVSPLTTDDSVHNFENFNESLTSYFAKSEMQNVHVKQECTAKIEKMETLSFCGMDYGSKSVDKLPVSFKLEEEEASDFPVTTTNDVSVNIQEGNSMPSDTEDNCLKEKIEIKNQCLDLRNVENSAGKLGKSCVNLGNAQVEELLCREVGKLICMSSCESEKCSNDSDYNSENVNEKSLAHLYSVAHYSMKRGGARGIGTVKRGSANNMHLCGGMRKTGGRGKFSSVERLKKTLGENERKEDENECVINTKKDIHSNDKKFDASIGKFKLNMKFMDVVTSYCLRILEQAEREISTEASSGWMNLGYKCGVTELSWGKEFKECVSVEAIRILDLLCLIDAKLVLKAFVAVKRMYERTADRQCGIMFIAVLQFFLNHSQHVIFDIDPVIYNFFVNYVSVQYRRHLLAMNTLMFLTANTSKLLLSTNVFYRYFPTILKLLAYHPRTVVSEVLSVLPAMVCPNTFSELFHTLLDLPLTAAFMEQEYDFGVSDVTTERECSNFKALQRYILRNEAGIFCIWDDIDEPLQAAIRIISSALPVTSRVSSICKLIPKFLRVFFNVFLLDASEADIEKLIALILQRFSTIFPLEFFTSSIHSLFVETLLTIFSQCPRCLLSQKKEIVHAIATHLHGEGVLLVLNLCWLIGEYVNPDLALNCDAEQVSDFFDSLEDLAYEAMKTMETVFVSSPTSELINVSYSSCDLATLKNSYNSQADSLNFNKNSAFQPLKSNISQNKDEEQSKRKSFLFNKQHNSKSASNLKISNTIEESRAGSKNILSNDKDAERSRINLSICEPRFVAVLVAALTKFGLKFPDYIPRVILCFSKMLKYFYTSEWFLVKDRIHDSLQLFNFPSVAKSILKTSKHNAHFAGLISEKRPLSHLTHSLYNYIPGSYFHEFELPNRAPIKDHYHNYLIQKPTSLFVYYSPSTPGFSFASSTLLNENLFLEPSFSYAQEPVAMTLLKQKFQLEYSNAQKISEESVKETRETETCKENSDGLNDMRGAECSDKKLDDSVNHLNFFRNDYKNNNASMKTICAAELFCEGKCKNEEFKYCEKERINFCEIGQNQHGRFNDFKNEVRDIDQEDYNFNLNVEKHDKNLISPCLYTIPLEHTSSSSSDAYAALCSNKMVCTGEGSLPLTAEEAESNSRDTHFRLVIKRI